MKNLILLLFAALFFSACNKTPPNPDLDYTPNYSSTIYCSQGTLDYCIFKPGTYWVYREAGSGKTDSVYVYKLTTDTVTTGTTNNFKVGDEFYMYCYDTYNHDSVVVIIPSYYSTAFPDALGAEPVRIKKGDPTDYSAELDYPIYPGGTVYGGTGDMMSVSYKFFSESINTFSFDSLCYISHTNMIVRATPDFPLGRPCKEYFARHYGLVRYDLPDSTQVWKLLKCHLIQ